MRIEHVDTTSTAETTIVVEGLQNVITLVHITDSHMAEADERDAEAIEVGTQLRERFRARSGENVAPRDNFRRALARSKELGADYVVMTGDIIHFPSLANVEAIRDEVAAVDVPYLYTPGNHDWHFPHLLWSDETRAHYYPRFHGLTGGNPAFQARDIRGIRLVAIDNSNYQISAAQLAFLQAQLAAGLPCLLFMHIPIYIPSLAPDVLATWQAPIMMAAAGWTAETQKAWQVRDADASTQTCYEMLTEGQVDNLVGIFCGHVHFAHTDAFRDGRFQYVTGPGFQGAYRVIHVVPA